MPDAAGDIRTRPGEDGPLRTGQIDVRQRKRRPNPLSLVQLLLVTKAWAENSAEIRQRTVLRSGRAPKGWWLEIPPHFVHPSVCLVPPLEVPCEATSTAPPLGGAWPSAPPPPPPRSNYTGWAGLMWALIATAHNSHLAAANQFSGAHYDGLLLCLTPRRNETWRGKLSPNGEAAFITHT